MGFFPSKEMKNVENRSLELNVARKISLISTNYWKSIYVIQLWTRNGNEQKSCKLTVWIRHHLRYSKFRQMKEMKWYSSVQAWKQLVIGQCIKISSRNLIWGKKVLLTKMWLIWLSVLTQRIVPTEHWNFYKPSQINVGL